MSEILRFFFYFELYSGCIDNIYDSDNIVLDRNNIFVSVIL